MNLLITNDDGIESEGIAALVRVLQPNHNVTVVAPNGERSGVGHAISLTEMIRAEECTRFPGIEAVRITGTPADCVKFGVLEVMHHGVDLVISGINRGQNLGTDVYYSGTVSAAMEAHIMGLPSLAVSVTDWQATNFDVAANFVADFLNQHTPTGRTTWNINIPNVEKVDIQGVRYTPLGEHIYSDGYEKRLDPLGRSYYWLTGKPLDSARNPEDCDVVWNRRGYITVTPLLADFTDYATLRRIQEELQDS